MVHMLKDTNHGQADANNGHNESAATDSNPIGTKPQIRYRVEYQDSTTGQVLHSQEGSEPATLRTNSREPPFEEVKIFRIKPWRTGNTTESTSTATDVPVYPGAVPPSRLLRIFSPAIINALQSVVQYYPGQDLTGDVVEVRWPYPILVHHYDELSGFAEECATKDQSLLCERERDAASHIKLLLDYLDADIMDTVRAEKERNRKGFYTFEGFWVGHKPGTTILQSIVEDKNMERLVVHSVTGGIFEYLSTDWSVDYWGMEFDGTYFGRTMRNIGATRKFDGERVLDAGSFLLIGFGEIVACPEEHADLVQQIIEEGKLYWNLLKKQCKFHKGKVRGFPYNEVCLRQFLISTPVLSI